MDTEIAWEECVDDIPLDTKHLPSLNALSTNSTHLPDIDLLDLFSFDHGSNAQNRHGTSATSPHHQIQSITTPPSSSNDDTSHLPETTSIPSQFINILDSPVTSAPSPSPSSPGGTSSTQSGRHSSNCSESSDIKQHPQLQTHQSFPPSPQNEANNNNNNNNNNTGLTDQSQLVLELSTRLASAGAEATALRKRVASLSAENRSLRAALDHANARLIAVAQAATATAHPSSTQPLMLGLAHVTADVANQLTGALTVSDPNVITTTNATGNSNSYTSNIENPDMAQHYATEQQQNYTRSNKKRKRVGGAAATTMACVMFMWGALVGSPGWLTSSSSSTTRTQGALPAIWNNADTTQHTAVASVNSNTKTIPSQHHRESWQPNCMRVLERLPDGNEHKKSKQEPVLVVGGQNGNDNNMDEDGDQQMVENDMFVDVVDNKATAKAVATADHYSDKLPKYSYVLCRDTQTAMNNVKACTKRMRDGLACGEPHTISLILPASVAGLEDTDSNETGSRPNHLDLAEVQCSITSVAKIPVGDIDTEKNEVSKDGDGNLRFGRVIASVAETGTAVIG